MPVRIVAGENPAMAQQRRQQRIANPPIGHIEIEPRQARWRRQPRCDHLALERHDALPQRRIADAEQKADLGCGLTASAPRSLSARAAGCRETPKGRRYRLPAHRGHAAATAFRAAAAAPHRGWPCGPGCARCPSASAHSPARRNPSARPEPPPAAPPAPHPRPSRCRAPRGRRLHRALCRILFAWRELGRGPVPAQSSPGRRGRIVAGA